MSNEIVNKVANSSLINVDLSDFAPKDNIIVFDIKEFLFKGLILKERDFRKALKEFDFTKYKGSVICVTCSSDAIVPMWVYMLITSYLNPISDRIYFGNKKEVYNYLFLKNIHQINSDDFTGKKVIVKGCGNVPLSEDLYIAITQKLQNSVRILMFGEACSAVPVYKNKNK